MSRLAVDQSVRAEPVQARRSRPASGQTATRGIDARAITDTDIFMLNQHLRACDRQELVASSGADIHKTLRDSVALSTHSRAFFRHGSLLCLMGVVPIAALSGVGCPWLLGTTALVHCPRDLVRTAPPYIAAMLAAYPRLINYVDARNTQSIRWLKRLGFVFAPAIPYGASGLPFFPFELRISCV